MRADPRCSLRDRFPVTFAELGALPGGERILEHVCLLDEGWSRRTERVAISDGDGPGRGEMDVDVALAGGGLSLIYAAYLARAGYAVAVFDRGPIGRAHREWNISRAELAPLVQSGLFTDDEVAALVKFQYRDGIVRWHRGATYRVPHVLDCVVDAQGLLDALRRRAEAAGVLLLAHHRLDGYRVGRGGVALDLRERIGSGLGDSDGDGDGERPRRLTTRLLLDGIGAMSPHARFDLVCPTVGGVLDDLEIGSGEDQLDPEVGEILISTEGIEEDRQHIWEGFPGSERGSSTVYLFYYAEPDTLGERPLLSLYERFFRLRPRYKRGPARLAKATYGYIPAYTRLREAPTAPSDRVLLVGDAAGRHSPLTFCGFGSMIRSFKPVSDGIRARLDADRLEQRSLAGIWDEPPALRLLGALSLMMVPRAGRGAFGRPRGDGERQGEGDINQLLDTAFGALASLGDEVFGQMVRDEIRLPDFVRFMRLTARRRPGIYHEAFQQLSPAELATWSMHFARLAARSALGRA